MRFRKMMVLAAFAAAPMATAGAQFTTVVAPPPAQKQAVAVAAAAKTETRADTAHRATMQAMSAWVDSVAGTPAPAVVSDSTAGNVAAGNVAAATDSMAAPTVRQERSGTTRFADGAEAPNTASPLPFLLVVGVGALLLGGWLVMTGSQGAPAPAPAKPRRRAP